MAPVEVVKAVANGFPFGVTIGHAENNDIMDNEIRKLKAAGFVEVRSGKGSHLLLKHPTTGKEVWVAVHTKKDAGRLGNRILREAGDGLLEGIAQCAQTGQLHRAGDAAEQRAVGRPRAEQLRAGGRKREGGEGENADITNW